MKISYNWLKEWVDVRLEPEVLAEKLAGLGFPVDGITRTGVSIDGIVVAKINSVEKHPNADRLRIAMVDDGNGERLVVCGAPNIAPGQIVPLALPGTEFPGGLTIQISKIRGVESHGMLCSARELGLSDDHAGIYMLPEKSKLGQPVKKALGQDVIFDIDVTPNRPDALSHYGIAREIAVLTGKKLKPAKFKWKKGSAGPACPIKIEDGKACPRYMGKVFSKVSVGPSPDWMAQRLVNCGIRSINNIVDITNYVLLEFGHPLHAFDLSLLNGPKIVVRKAAEGEKILALDEKEYKLSSKDLVIADGKGPVAIAGVMGGEGTGVTDKTEAILLESAVFERSAIRETSRSLGLKSESSIRFEKGTDAQTAEWASLRAADLIQTLAGGVPGKAEDKFPGKLRPKKISLRFSKLEEWTGKSYPAAKAKTILKDLGFTVRPAGKNISVEPPPHRKDILEEVDVVEEVVRVVGYDTIPVNAPSLVSQPLPSGLTAASFENLIQHFKTNGLNETMTNSFTKEDWLKMFGIEKEKWVEVANPVSAEEPFLRPLLAVNLLRAVKRNMNYQASSVRLFEIGHVFEERDGSSWPAEEKRAGFVLAGEDGPLHWRRPSRKVDFITLKNHLESLDGFLGGALRFHFGQGPDCLHPKQKMEIEFHGRIIGWAGMIHPFLAEQADIKPDCALAEWALSGLKPKKPEYKPASDIPFVERDIAILVDQEKSWSQIEDLVVSQGRPLLKSVTLFDLFSGKGIDPGKKSLAFRVRLHNTDKTLSEKEINDCVEQIKSALQNSAGAQLR